MDPVMENENLRNEIGKLRNRLVEAISEICFNCEEYIDKDDRRCEKCKWRRMREGME
jgi:hypothetical protein